MAVAAAKVAATAQGRKTNKMITRLLKQNWKIILTGLAAPILVVLAATKLKAMDSPAKPNAAPVKPYENLNAFLLMIQYGEGTKGINAYRMLYGGKIFYDYSRHPNTPVTRWGITSTAAGAYQILYHTWVGVQQALGLADFSPSSQNRAAVELIRRRGALEDVLAGRLAAAIEKCKKEWASLPGAGYGQKEQRFAVLMQVYQQAGGHLT